jgi:hypothetical protein
VLIDLLTFIPIHDINVDEPQVLALVGRIQGQLRSLSATLASAGKVLIGPNLIVQPTYYDPVDETVHQLGPVVDTAHKHVDCH